MPEQLVVGADIRYSTDFGKSWIEHEGGIRFAEGSERKVKRVWYIKPGRESEPETYFAGVDPGAR